MSTINISGEDAALPSVFQKSPHYPEFEFRNEEGIFRASTLDINKLKIVSLPTQWSRPHSLVDYMSATSDDRYLRLDRFTCAAILLNLGMWEKCVQLHGPFPDLTRFIFDGTAWKDVSGAAFPAIAFIDGRFTPDIFPLNYLDDVDRIRRVVADY